MKILEAYEIYQTQANVKVKEGTRDPDFGTDISGWQGRIQEVDEDSDEYHVLYLVAWDSITLEQMDVTTITQSVEDDLDWGCMFLFDNDLQAAEPRDEESDVTNTRNRIRVDMETAWERCKDAVV